MTTSSHQALPRPPPLAALPRHEMVDPYSFGYHTRIFSRPVHWSLQTDAFRVNLITNRLV